MRHATRKRLRFLKLVLRNVAGVLLILLGVISGFIPILQGWILILAGISMLKFEGKAELIAKFKRIKWIAPHAKRYDHWKRRVAKRAKRKVKRTGKKIRKRLH